MGKGLDHLVLVEELFQPEACADRFETTPQKPHACANPTHEPDAVKLDPQRQYVMGVHPHSILPFGGMINVSTDVNRFPQLFEGIDFRTLSASFCFYVPLYRDLLLAGGVIDAVRTCLPGQAHSVLMSAVTV